MQRVSLYQFQSTLIIKKKKEFFGGMDQMKRKYKAIYDKSTDTYTLESLTKSRKTKMDDVIGDITPSDLKTIEKAMGIVIVAYEEKPNK